jgi:hypothetical protein
VAGVAAVHAGGGLEVGHGAAVALGEPGNAELGAQGRVVGIALGGILEIRRGLGIVLAGEGDFTGHGEHADIVAGRFERRGQRACGTVGATEAQLGGGQQAQRVEVVGRGFQHLVELGLGGLQVAERVFDCATEQQRGRVVGRGFEHGGEVIACVRDLFFLEIDQGLGIARLQIAGRGLECGVDFLAGVVEPAIGKRDISQCQPRRDVARINPEDFLIDHGGFGRLPGSAQQRAFQLQAVAVAGVDPQGFVERHACLGDVVVGQRQMRPCQMDVGVVGRVCERALQGLACRILAIQAEFGGGAQRAQTRGVVVAAGGHGQFVEHTLEFALPQQRAGDHGVGRVFRIAGLAGAAEFFLGAGEIKLLEIQLAQFETRFGIVLVLCDGVFQLDDCRLVIARCRQGPGFVHQGGAVSAVAGAQQTGTKEHEHEQAWRGNGVDHEASGKRVRVNRMAECIISCRFWPSGHTAWGG